MILCLQKPFFLYIFDKTKNRFDIVNMLLVHKKQTLISEGELLNLSLKVVNRYVSYGSIPERERDDVQMAVVERFLQKKESITNAFNGGSKVSTYLIAVLNRMCCEVIRKELKHWNIGNSDNSDQPSTRALSSSEHLIIADEIKLLGRILILFNNEYHKIRLFLACYYQLVLNTDDICAYDSFKMVDNWVSTFSQDNNLNKGELFEKLAIMVNRVEDKQLKADAVRMWLNKVTDIIITRLNSTINRSSHDKETFQLLFEYYYRFEQDKV